MKNLVYFFKSNSVYFLLLFFLILYITIAYFGYGNDSDIFRLIQSGQYLLQEFEYCPSRFQGNLVPEIIIGFTSLIGSYYLSNAVSVLLGIGVLFLCYLLLKDVFERKDILLVISIIGFNSYFILMSTSSMDYIYSLFFAILGIYFLKSKKYWLASIIFAISLSSRLASLPIVFASYLYFFYANENFHLLKNFNFKDIVALFKTEAFLSSLFTVFLIILFYIPAYISADYSFKFISHVAFEWSYWEHVVRYIYRNISLLGWLIFTFIVLSLVFYKRLYTFHNFKKTPNLWIYIFIFLVFSELLFLKVPTEIDFLVPLLFVIVPLYVYFSKFRTLPYTLLFFTIMHSFVFSIELFKSEQCENPEEKYNKTITVNFSKGIVTEDIAPYYYTCSEQCGSICNTQKPDEVHLKREHSYLYFREQNLVFKDDTFQECK